MYKLDLCLGLTIMVASACSHDNAGRFHINGSIPGITDNSVVILEALEQDGNSVNDTVKAADGNFSFDGVTDRPILCRIVIKDENLEDPGRSIELMLENCNYTVSAANIDSVPPTLYTGSKGKRMETNVDVKGGVAQREFQEFQDYMRSFEVQLRDATRNLFCGDCQEGSEQYQQLDSIYNNRFIAQNNAFIDFIESHPAYNISMLYRSYMFNEPFSYSNEDLDKILSGINESNWTARRDSLIKQIERYRDKAAYTPYKNITFNSFNGESKSLSEFVGSGKYLLVDFWASWCAPCRAAIPYVKTLADKYKDNLSIISVSIDQNKEAWEKALSLENMSWPQFNAGEQDAPEIMNIYHFQSIPTFILIDPDGRIVLEVKEPRLINKFLETKSI